MNTARWIQKGRCWVTWTQKRISLATLKCRSTNRLKVRLSRFWVYNKVAPFILKFFLRIFLVLCIFLFLCFLLIFEFQIESFSPKPLFIIQSPYPIGNPSVVRPQTDEARGGTGRKDTLTEFPQRRNGTQKHFYGQKKNSLDYHLFASRNQQRRKKRRRW